MGRRVVIDGARPNQTALHDRLPVNHAVIDDGSLVAYSEILDNEQGDTAAAFRHRAHPWFADHGITIERAITDNGSR